MQPKIFPTIRAVTVALLATAVFGAGTGAAAPASEPALVIGMPGVPPVFLGVREYVALDRGLYAKYVGRGARVSLEPFTTDLGVIQAVQSGQIALAWAPTPEVLAEIARGEPLVAIEGMDSPDWEIGSTDASITTCAQLKGQTIGVDAVGGARYDALIAMLAACGLSIQDVNVIAFPGDAGMNAQISGQLSLYVEHYDEAAQVQAMGKPLTVVERLSDVDPDQHFDMLVTTEDELARHRPLLVRVIEADIAATRWLYQPSNLAIATGIAQITGESASVVSHSISHYVAADWWNIGTSGLSPDRVASTIALELKLGVIAAGGRPLTYANVANTTLWNSAARALG